MPETTGLTGPVLVCVTPQSSCKRLIKAGELIALQNRMPLIVLSVFREKQSINPENSAILEELYEAARLSDATMRVYYNDNPDILTAVVAAREKAGLLVTGFPRERSTGFVTKIHELLPALPIVMLDDNMNEYKILPNGAQVPSSILNTVEI